MASALLSISISNADSWEKQMHYLEDVSIREAIERLDLKILTYEPEKFLTRYVRDVRGIYHCRFVVRGFIGSNEIISYIANIIVGAIEAGERMRTLDCLKVLKSLVKQNATSELELQSDTIDKLFRIYQEFIFRDNEEVQWCVSVFLKDRPLSEDAIDWLIDNESKSDHIVNRLLLYPIPSDPKILSWAQKVYEEDALPDRRSEIIAILLSACDANDLASDNDPNEFLWGVFKSHLPYRDKVALLKKHCCLEAFGSVVDIASRLKSPDILQHFLRKLKRKPK